jgi:hypothetical protein
VYGLGIWEILCCTLFCAELTTRAYCYKIARGGLFEFFKNIFNQIDLLVISIDIIFLALPEDRSSGGNGQYTKVLRLIRLIRLLRVLRAAR